MAVNGRDFTKITSPIKTRGESINPFSPFLHNPRTVAIDNGTQNIFITDTSRKRVEVFNSDLDYLYHFPDCMNDETPLPKRIGEPWGLAITESLIFLTHILEIPPKYLPFECSQNITIFLHNGSFVTNFEYSKDFYVTLEELKGIAVDCDNTLYSCCFDKVLTQVTEMPNCLLFVRIARPMDIKIYSSRVIILSGSFQERCAQLTIFTKSAVKIRSIIIKEFRIRYYSRSPEYFSIDPNTGTFLISHIGRNAIFIYDWLGNYKGCIEHIFRNIKGLAVDKYSRIVNVCENTEIALKVL